MPAVIAVAVAFAAFFGTCRLIEVFGSIRADRRLSWRARWARLVACAAVMLALATSGHILLKSHGIAVVVVAAVAAALTSVLAGNRISGLAAAAWARTRQRTRADATGDQRS